MAPSTHINTWFAKAKSKSCEKKISMKNILFYFILTLSLCEPHHYIRFTIMENKNPLTERFDVDCCKRDVKLAAAVIAMTRMAEKPFLANVDADEIYTHR